MPFHIIAVGQKMPDWVTLAYTEYAKRMPHEFRLMLQEIRPELRTQSKSIEQIKEIEAHRIETALPSSSRLLVLDEHGLDMTTATLAKLITQLQEQGRPITFVIGGADGLHERIKSKGRLLRLSSMTLPHGLVRVLLAEQLYRAWSILANHPYHRA
jgi:23S rRNA (pseudouridine1915-N3)-methyltransferase